MATLGLRGLALVMGAGYTGTFVYNNLNLDSARSLAGEILLRHQNANSNSTNHSPDAAGTTANATSPAVGALSEQVDRLTREVARSRSDPVLIVGPTGYKGSLATISDVFNLLGWAVFAVSVGGAVYYIAVRKRLSLRDLAWVSQSTFNGTVSAMQKGITSVSGAVRAVRRDLSERLRMMEEHVNTVHVTLAKQIETEVAEVKVGVDKVGDEVSNVKRGVDDANSRIEQMDSKIDLTNSGIRALASVVSSMAPNQLRAGSPFHELKKFVELTDNGHAPELESAQLRPRLSTGLAGLLGSRRPGKSADDPSSVDEQSNKSRSLDMPASVLP